MNNLAHCAGGKKIQCISVKKENYTYAGTFTSIHLLYIRLRSASDTLNTFLKFVEVLQNNSCIASHTQQLYLIITEVRLVVGLKGQSPTISNNALLDKSLLSSKKKQKNNLDRSC